MPLLQIHFAQNLPILPAFCLLLLPTYFSNFFADRIDASQTTSSNVCTSNINFCISLSHTQISHILLTHHVVHSRDNDKVGTEQKKSWHLQYCLNITSHSLTLIGYKQLIRLLIKGAWHLPHLSVHLVSVTFEWYCIICTCKDSVDPKIFSWYYFLT